MMYQPHLLQDFRFQKSEMSSDEKKQAIKQQSERLGNLQMELQRSKLPVIVLVEGWGTSGKGTQIASMIQELDPRFFQVISLSAPSPEELAKPFLSIGNQYGEGWFLTGEMAELVLSGTPNIVCIQPFACLPNHVVGKGVIKALKKAYPQSNIVAVDYDPGASEVNQLNRIKLMLSTAKKRLAEEETAAV